MVEISFGTQSDLSRCLEVRSAAFSDQAPCAYTKREVEASLERDESEGMLQMISDGQLFVARHSGELVGLAGWKGQNVYNLYVDPPYMRRGIAAKLLASVEEQFMQKTSFETILVDAGLYTKNFYESQGYDVVGEPVSSDGLSYLEMQKRIR